MTTIPPASAIRKKLSQWILGQQAERAAEAPRMTPEQYGVAAWLDKERLESLSRLLYARIEGRGAMPVPSNPHDAVVRVAADVEARMIIAELTFCATQPAAVINPGIEEQE